METVNVYTIKELKEEFPEEYNKAFGKFQQEQYEDIPWRNELLGSFTKTFEMAGVNLQNYSLGLSQSSVRFTMPTYWSELAECDMLVEDYTGQRAKNWLKGAFEIHSVKLVHYKGDKGKSCKRYDFRNGDGTYWEGFTGYCADYDFVESLFMEINDGETLEDAFRNLAYVYEKLLNAELEYNQSEENFLEMCEINDWKFLEDGRLM